VSGRPLRDPHCARFPLPSFLLSFERFPCVILISKCLPQIYPLFKCLLAFCSVKHACESP
jgi:hypothetical protein